MGQGHHRQACHTNHAAYPEEYKFVISALPKQNCNVRTRKNKPSSNSIFHGYKRVEQAYNQWKKIAYPTQLTVVFSLFGLSNSSLIRVPCFFSSSLLYKHNKKLSPHVSCRLNIFTAKNQSRPFTNTCICSISSSNSYYL